MTQPDAKSWLDAAAGGIGLVQGAQNLGASDTTATLAFPKNLTQGDFAVVIGNWGNGATATSVTDTAGNTYARVGNAIAIQDTQGVTISTMLVFDAWNIAGGPSTVTMHFSSTAVMPELRIAELSGIATGSSPLDSWTSRGGAGNSMDSGPVTTANAHDLLFAANVAGDTTDATDPAFTRLTPLDDHGDIVEIEEATATGSYTATAHQNSNVWWLMAIYAFRAAP